MNKHMFLKLDHEHPDALVDIAKCGKTGRMAEHVVKELVF